MDDYELYSVEISDYRQYRDTQRFELHTKDERRINIIEGQNGAGKSNFLNALSLCLYGEELHGSEQQKQGNTEGLESLPLVNTRRFEECDIGDSAKGHIEVTFSHGTSRFAFRREFETKRTADEEFENEIHDLRLTQLTNGDWTQVENPHTVLNSILPQDIKDYYIFDAEDLDNLFKKKRFRQIRAGVLQISQIDLIDRGIYHLKKLRDDLEKEVSELGGETESIREELNNIRSQLEQQKELKADLQDEIENAKSEIKRIDEELQDAQNERVIELRSRRSSLEENLDQLNKRREEVRENLADILVGRGPAVLAHDALLSCHQQIQQTATDEHIPPGATETLVESLLSREKCLCGQELSPGSAHRQELEDLREDLTDGDRAYAQAQTTLPRLINSATERNERVRDSRENLRSIEDDINDVQIELEDISNELKNYDIPDIDTEALESERKTLQESIERANKKIGTIESKIDDLETKEKQLEEKFKKELRKDEKQKRAISKLEFVRESRQELEEIREQIVDEVRSDTEDRMQSYYNELIWKEDSYRIIVNDDFSVEVYVEGEANNLIGSLSAGERQVLALSYMAAIAEESGFEAPTVIDTPLGRISSKPRRRIAQNLPKYLEGHQITFLMTDEEYTEAVETLLEERVANEYHLEYEDGATEVVRVE